MELKRCSVIDMRWKRKLGSRLSPEIDAILRPISEKKATLLLLLLFYYSLIKLYVIIFSTFGSWGCIDTQNTPLVTALAIAQPRAYAYLEGSRGMSPMATNNGYYVGSIA